MHCGATARRRLPGSRCVLRGTRQRGALAPPFSSGVCLFRRSFPLYILLWSACTQIKRCIPPKNGPWSLALSVARARKFSRKFLSFATPRPDHHSKVFSHWAKSSAPMKFVKSNPKQYKQPSRQTPLACARQVVLVQIDSVSEYYPIFHNTNCYCITKSNQPTISS